MSNLHNPSAQQSDTNYFVQLDTKYDYPTSPENGQMDAYHHDNGYSGYDAKGPDFSYPAGYGVGTVPYGGGGGGGEGMQFGGSNGMGGIGEGGREGGNEEFDEYLQLMVYFRWVGWFVCLMGRGADGIRPQGEGLEPNLTEDRRKSPIHPIYPLTPRSLPPLSRSRLVRSYSGDSSLLISSPTSWLSWTEVTSGTPRSPDC